MTLRLIPNQKAQSDFLFDMAPGETAYVSGWGGGKTWAGARKLIILTSQNGCPSLAVAPTYADLGRFVIPALYDAAGQFGLKWSDSSRSPDRPHVMVGDWMIHTMSAEKPQRFAGFEVGAIWIDEAARIRTSSDDPLMDAPLQIRSRLRHPDAKSLHLLVTTTPEGPDTWVERDFGVDSGRRLYRGSTLRNEHLPQSYIDQIKRSLPPELLDQYLHGHAVSYVADRAHPQFAEATHVAPYTPDSARPVHMGCDFNVSPMAWVLAQEDGDRLRVFDEVSIEDGATVEMAMRRANQQGWGNFPLVHLHLDRSAKNRSTVGPAQYEVITAEARRYGWNITGNVDGVNPPINARIDRLSTRLLNGEGLVGLTIDPRCRALIHNLNHTARGSNGYNPGRDGKLGHILDALGYLVWDVDKPAQAEAVSWF